MHKGVPVRQSRNRQAILAIHGMSVIMLRVEINRNTGTHARINSEEMINDFSHALYLNILPSGNLR